MARGDEPPGALSLRRSESASPIGLPGQATPLAAEDEQGLMARGRAAGLPASDPVSWSRGCRPAANCSR
jgi:hypothetical protein